MQLSEPDVVWVLRGIPLESSQLQDKHKQNDIIESIMCIIEAQNVGKHVCNM